MNAPPAPTPRRLVRATAIALGVAAVLLFTVVLPAEYGWDPLGTGSALGLVELANPSAGEIPVRSDGLIPQPGTYRVDARTFAIEPEGFVEYKFRLEAGEAMVYAWSATGSVRAEMHAERDGAPEGTAEFFEVVESTTTGAGSYVAPFPGDHGWYWGNLGTEPISLTIHAAGFFDDSIEYPQRGDPILRDVTAEPGDSGP